MSKCYWDIELDRCFYELRWIILCLSIQGGPVTERRIYRYCIAHYNVHRFFCRYVIRQALRKGIIKYVNVSDSYVLIPPPRKLTKKKLPSKGEDMLPDASAAMWMRQLFERCLRFLGSCIGR